MDWTIINRFLEDERWEVTENKEELDETTKESSNLPFTTVSVTVNEDS